MKNIVLLAIAISVFGCGSSKNFGESRISNLKYEIYQEDEKVDLYYDEEIPMIIDNWAYITRDLQIIPWEMAYKHIVAGETLPKKVSADNPFVPVKFWDSKAMDYVDTVEVESIKAVVTKGEELWFKTIFATEENLDLNIPTVTIDGEEYILSFFENVEAVCEAHGIMDFYYAEDVPEEWMDKVIFITPYVKGKTEIMVKNGCGNITIINPGEIYIYIPKSFVVKEDKWLKPSREIATISSSRESVSESSSSANSKNRQLNSEKVGRNNETKTSKDLHQNASKENCPNPYNKHIDNKTGYIYTKVCVKGDGLYRIAERFNVSFEKLLKMNPKLKKRPKNLIEFGEYIRIK